MRTYRSHASANLEIDILHFHVVVELHAESFQILDHRQNHRLILVVTGKTQRTEVRQSANMMNISTDIQLHLQRTMPIFKSEHSAPVHPEIRIENLIVEIIRNFLAVQFLIRREEQLHDLHRGFVRQIEFAVRACVNTARFRGAAEREVGIFLVQPVILVKYGNAFRFDGWNGTEHVPHHFEVVVHFTAAAHHIANAGNICAIAGASRNRVLFEYVNVAARQLRISHQVTGCGECGQAGADDVRVLAVHAFGFLRSGECFVIAVGIIHDCLLWMSLHILCRDIA